MNSRPPVYREQLPHRFRLPQIAAICALQRPYCVLSTRLGRSTLGESPTPCVNTPYALRGTSFLGEATCIRVITVILREQKLRSQDSYRDSALILQRFPTSLTRVFRFDSLVVVPTRHCLGSSPPLPLAQHRCIVMYRNTTARHRRPSCCGTTFPWLPQRRFLRFRNTLATYQPPPQAHTTRRAAARDSLCTPG